MKNILRMLVVAMALFPILSFASTDTLACSIQAKVNKGATNKLTVNWSSTGATEGTLKVDWYGNGKLTSLVNPSVLTGTNSAHTLPMNMRNATIYGFFFSESGQKVSCKTPILSIR